MTAHEIHALSGAYAMDALDDLERARFEAHLAACAECRAEVASLQDTAALLSTVADVAPPPAMRDRILADIKSVRPLPPVVARLEARRPRRWAGMVAAAAAIAVVGGGVTVWQNVGHGSSAPQLSAADGIIKAADVRLVSEKLSNGAEVKVYRSTKKNAAVLVAKKMPAAPLGKVYELWFRNGKQMIPAGTFSTGDRPVLFRGAANQASGVGITVEPQGGSEQPTTLPVALLNFGSTT